MIDEAKLIDGIANRRARVMLYGVVVLALTAFLLLVGYAWGREHADLARVQFALINDEQTAIRTAVPEMIYGAMRVNRIYVGMMLLSCVLGITGTALILELKGSTRDRLILSMWSRLESMEENVSHSLAAEVLNAAAEA